MNIAPPIQKPNARDDKGAVYVAVADAMSIAGTYAATAIHFADIRDERGLAYATGCAAAAVATAAVMVAELRPSSQGRAS